MTDALNDLDAAVAAVHTEFDAMTAQADAANKQIADLTGKNATLTQQNATLTQQLADCQASLPKSGPRVGLYVAGGQESSMESAEATAKVPVGTFVPVWFFFPSLTAATPLAIQRQVAPLAAAGRRVFLNVSAANKNTPSTTWIKWADVPSGRYDAALNNVFTAMTAAKVMDFIWNQEPDQAAFHAPNFECGTPQDYDAAVKHIKAMLPAGMRLGFCCAVASRIPTWCLTPSLYDFFSMDFDNRSTAGWQTPTQLWARDKQYVPAGAKEVFATAGTIADPNNPNRRTDWINEIPKVTGLTEWVYWGSDDSTGKFSLTPPEMAVLGQVALA